MSKGVSSSSVAVVIVAHRQYETLALCLNGFRKAVTRSADVIFVDNGSNGKLTAWAKQAFPDITILTLDENRLFCGGYNAGIQQAMAQNYEFVMIVNADTEILAPSFIFTLVDVMKRWPRAAFVGPQVFLRTEGYVQNTIFNFPSISYSVLAWIPHRFFPRLLKRDLGREQPVETLNGVCVLCRLAALKEIGLMDETLGAYIEDTDWSWRAHLLGWTSVYAPVPSIIHHEEPTGYEHYALKTFLLKRNIVRWYLKTGDKLSARLYAAAAIGLAKLRAYLAAPSEKVAYQEFETRLGAVYSRMLAGEELGSWFGTPLDIPGYGERLQQKIDYTIEEPFQTRQCDASTSNHKPS